VEADEVSTDPANLEAWLRLSFVNIPAGRCRSALERWGSPQALLEAASRGRDDALLQTPGVTPTTIERLREASTRDISGALRAIDECGIWLLLDTSPLYPAALRAIHDPPVFLWVRGTLDERDEVAVGIVGTRRVSEYGRGMAQRLAGDLARAGVTVVSGLARGIDTAAHRGALEAGGRTLACCGCGLDIVYPGENRALMDAIIQNGATISEFAPTTHPEPWHFPARNRIISGLSAGIVVVEAAERSGALITADYAMEQGREVFAVPGNALKPQSRGPHGLIKQGAALVESAQDILEALDARALPFEPAARSVPPPALGASTSRRSASRATDSKPRAAQPELPMQDEPDGQGALQKSETRAPQVRAELSEEENRVYGALDYEARHIDSIAQDASMGAAQASATLLLLELKRLARRLPGGMFERAA
jgi:DNA processing protein